MKIFIGSSSEAADKTNPNKNILLKIAGILKGAKMEPLPWNRTPSIFKAGLSTLENLEELIKRECVGAAVFIYSGDDNTWYRGEKCSVPRDNVVFEHGFFTGKLGRTKAIIIKVGNAKIPSDLLGITHIDYDENQYEAELKILDWVSGLEEPVHNSETEKDYGVKINIQKPITDRGTKPATKGLVEFVSIPPGSYYRLIDDKEIKIDNFLSISKNLVTQSVYNSIMGNNPSNFKGDSLPVENVSFRDVIVFCNKLSKKEGHDEVYTITDNLIKWNEAAKGYRLPFEIEWEYALGYSDIEIQKNLDAIAWYCNNSDGKTHDVGLMKGNRYGLFDLLGNVWEWCFDNYKEYPSQTIVLDNNTSLRVLRGGSFADFKNMFTKEMAFRKKQDESTQNRLTGFRIVLQNIKSED